MDFHLTFPVPAFSKALHYNEPILFIGSCFAENMGQYMQRYKFNAVINPHGVLYNPNSMETAIRRYIRKETLTEHDLFYANNCYHSWEHHSKFSNTQAAACLSTINDQIDVAHQQLKNAGWLFITFGSAYVYKHKQTGKRVGNCHKQPQQDFIKELLTVEELVKTYKQLMEELQKWNSHLKIVFTVSPVRYVRDGIVENTLSKSRLIELVHQLTNDKTIFYFPAYELVIDDLRDYRFYKSDLVHPTDQAIDYVFEKLTETLFDKTAISIFERIKDIIKAKAHRVLQKDTFAHQQFKSTYGDRCKQLKQQYPFLPLEEELSYFG